MASYPKRPCRYCGIPVSTCALGRASHLRVCGRHEVVRAPDLRKGDVCFQGPRRIVIVSVALNEEGKVVIQYRPFGVPAATAPRTTMTAFPSCEFKVKPRRESPNNPEAAS